MMCLSRAHATGSKTMFNQALIIGGTGTLGKALLKTLSEQFPNLKLAVMSRDEHKQSFLKREFPDVRFYVGDVRDTERVLHCVRGYDTVFHTAALKHVDILEDAPFESVKTNILGTYNVANTCLQNGVKNYVFFTTDKAVDPVNVYGHSKAIAEKLILDLKRKHKNTNVNIYRWGNILASQGSSIPYFINCIKNDIPINVTDLYMTRFYLKIDHAINFVLRTFIEKHEKVLIPPNMKSASNADIINAISCLLEKGFTFKIVGHRPGEKIHEAMTSQHSQEYLTSENAPRYTKEELMELLREFI